MLQGQALVIVLKMAKSMNARSTTREEREAIEEVEQLLTQFEDTGNYTEDDYIQETLNYEHGAIDLERDDNHYRE